MDASKSPVVAHVGLAGKGDFNELMTYSGQAGYKPDYLYLMQRLMMDNPEAAVNLAKMIAKQPGPPMDLNTLADLFLQRNAVREATAFLLDVLQENKPEHDKLQTKVSAHIALPASIVYIKGMGAVKVPCLSACSLEAGQVAISV